MIQKNERPVNIDTSKKHHNRANGFIEVSDRSKVCTPTLRGG